MKVYCYLKKMEIEGCKDTECGFYVRAMRQSEENLCGACFFDLSRVDLEKLERELREKREAKSRQSLNKESL
ncbi:MAG: hypothetical protein ACE5LX_06050 [Nitrospinota bacterium]